MTGAANTLLARSEQTYSVQRLVDVVLLSHNPELVWVGFMDVAFYGDMAGPGSDHAPKRLVTLAGHMAPVGEWKKFERLWEGVLAEPRFDIPYFHQQTFFQRSTHPGRTTKQFKPFDHKKWDDPALRDALIDRLQAVITSRKLWSHSTTLDLRAYDAVNSEFHLDDICGSPYTVCALNVMTLADRVLFEIAPSATDLMFIFEKGDVKVGQLDFKDSMIGPDADRPVIKGRKSIAHDGTPRYIRPFEAADLLAWHFKTVQVDPTMPKRHRAFFKMVDPGTHLRHRYIGAARLRAFCKEKNVPRR